MSIDLDAKLKAAANMIDGHVVDDSQRVGICVKGVVNGFPATIEAIGEGWPWPTTYTLETNPVVDPNQERQEYGTKITVCPRVGRGFFRFFTHVLLFESRGQAIGDKKLESQLIFSYDDRDIAERFLRYPGVGENLLALEHFSKFSEMVIKTDTGIYLSMPTNFKNLDLDIMHATFREMAELGSILFDVFS